jgi:hypothetical protein
MPYNNFSIAANFSKLQFLPQSQYFGPVRNFDDSLGECQLSSLDKFSVGGTLEWGYEVIKVHGVLSFLHLIFATIRLERP